MYTLISVHVSGVLDAGVRVIVPVIVWMREWIRSMYVCACLVDLVALCRLLKLPVQPHGFDCVVEW